MLLVCSRDKPDDQCICNGETGSAVWGTGLQTELKVEMTEGK